MYRSNSPTQTPDEVIQKLIKNEEVHFCSSIQYELIIKRILVQYQGCLKSIQFYEKAMASEFERCEEDGISSQPACYFEQDGIALEQETMKMLRQVYDGLVLRYKNQFEVNELPENLNWTDDNTIENDNSPATLEF